MKRLFTCALILGVLLMAGGQNLFAENTGSSGQIFYTQNYALTESQPMYNGFEQPEYRFINDEGYGISETEMLRKRLFLSSLWTFATLNYLYCDIESLMDPELHQEYESGEVDGFEINEDSLLGTSIFLQVPISMIVLNFALPPKALWITNIAAGIFMTGAQAASLFVGDPASYYILHSTVEIAATSFITYYAFRNLRKYNLKANVEVGKDSYAIKAGTYY